MHLLHHPCGRCSWGFTDLSFLGVNFPPLFSKIIARSKCCRSLLSFVSWVNIKGTNDTVNTLQPTLSNWARGLAHCLLCASQIAAPYFNDCDYNNSITFAAGTTSNRHVVDAAPKPAATQFDRTRISWCDVNVTRNHLWRHAPVSNTSMHYHV